MIENGNTAFLFPKDEYYVPLLSLFEREIADRERVVSRSMTSELVITVGDVVMCGVGKSEVPPDQETLTKAGRCDWNHGWPKRDAVSLFREGSQNHAHFMVTLVLSEVDVMRLLAKIDVMLVERSRRTRAEHVRRAEETRSRHRQDLMNGLDYLRSMANDPSRD